MNATSKSDPVALLQSYLGAFANRDSVRVGECFAQGAVLDLPAVKPSRFIGLDEIKTAHLWAFENLEDVRCRWRSMIRATQPTMRVWAFPRMRGHFRSTARISLIRWQRSIRATPSM
jgi:hypothetical protein